MSNIHSLQERRALKQKNRERSNQRMDEACDWVSKIDRNLTKKEKSSLQSWLADDSQNVKLFLEVANIWDKSSELDRLADVFPKETLAPKSLSKFTKTIAASLLFVLSFSIFQFSENFDSTTPDTVLSKMDTDRILETVVGESNTFTLSDGSKIVLNTATKAEIKFTPDLRLINLNQGEIHIDVAHDQSRPLQVKVGDKIVQAVGTAFNIELKDQLLELIVTDGKVIVKDAVTLETANNHTQISDADNEQKPTTISLAKPLVSVSKGEKINIEKTGIIKQQVIKVEPIEIVASLSWRQGNLIFRGESLQEAMDEISRYSDLTIQLDDDQKLKNIQVAGMFRTGDIEGLLSMLKSSFNIDYEKTAGETILLKLATST